MNTTMTTRRDFSEPFRAQTEADLETPDWNEFRYFDPQENPDVQYWQPGTKKKSFENGETFVFRILPACRYDQANDQASFPPGRNEKGLLDEGAIWPVNVVEKFGADRKVSFIPTLPYVPLNGTYPPHASPNDNPYYLLTSTLWRLKSSTKLPPSWRPLVMTSEEINEYRKKAKLFGAFHSQLLLPLPKWRYFSYSLIYRGYHLEAGEDFLYENAPYGIFPEQGLQLVSVNQQAFQDIQREYARRARSAASGLSDEFYFADPAEANQGMLNYVWNRKFPSPVDSNPMKLEGFGYAGAVENRYHLSPSQFQQIDLVLPAAFLQWYSRQWRPIGHVLRGTTGVELVRLLARFAPELREPCKLAWQRHRTLMEAWEEEFAGAPSDYDFHETLDMIYGTRETEQTRERSAVSGPERFEGETERTEISFEEMPHRAMSRTPSAVDYPAKTRNMATLPSGGTARMTSPLQAIGERMRYENTVAADEDASFEPNSSSGEELPF